MDWQPIETAPKDGTVILGVRFLSYLGDGEVFPDGGTIQWEGGPERVFKVGWAYTGHLVRMIPPEDAPTHWIPLPAPPANN